MNTPQNPNPKARPKTDVTPSPKRELAPTPRTSAEPERSGPTQMEAESGKSGLGGFIRRHPWASVGVGFALGALVGAASRTETVAAMPGAIAAGVRGLINRD